MSDIVGSGYSYADAVKLLDEDGALSKIVDKIVTIGLLAGSAVGLDLLLSLFDAKSEARRLSSDLIINLRTKMRTRRGASRTSYLMAAHSVIVMSSYFDSIDSADLPFSSRDIELIRMEQEWLISGGKLSASARDIVDVLSEIELPAPSPTVPYEDVLRDLEKLYQLASHRLYGFYLGLRVGERASALSKSKEHQLVNTLPMLAVAKYQDSFRRLAAGFPEFYIWAGFASEQATRALIHKLTSAAESRFTEILTAVTDLNASFAGMERLLSFTGLGSVDHAKSSVALRASDELNRPLVDRQALDAQARLTFPSVKDGYINPNGKVAQVKNGTENVGDDSWWAKQRVDSNLQMTFAGLATTHANAPIVVLGQPGAGKSLLTRVLTARLSQAGFLTVRVELRHVPADAPIQTQIEEGIYHSTGERVGWPDLVRSSIDAPRVVLLDGLDELIQNARTTRSDYLELVQGFQQRERSLGRDVCVIVTSRSVAASKTRFPIGSVVIMLEAFNDEQVDYWLHQWNQTNSQLFADEGIQPLTADTVAPHDDLARQPLLLLMLAIYDADSNALQKQGANFGKAQLYERLLKRFARREVFSRDHGATNVAESLDLAAERELQRLSITAVAMFNRGRQWVSATELGYDFEKLLTNASDGVMATGFHTPLTAAEMTVGRFFFIHESRSSGQTTKRTYEFLHPTFGEYLVARLVCGALSGLAQQRQLAQANPAVPDQGLDDGFLHCLLSCASLTDRLPIVEFLNNLIAEISMKERQAMRSTAILLFRLADRPDYKRSYDAYFPQINTSTARIATYTANLLILTVLLSDGEVDAQELFSDVDTAAFEWSRYASLWRSSLNTGAWESFMDLIRVHRRVHGMDTRTVSLSLRGEAGEAATWENDLKWSMHLGTRDEDIVAFRLGNSDEELSSLRSLCDPRLDALLSLVLPIRDIFGGNLFVEVRDAVNSDYYYFSGQALVELLIMPLGAPSEQIVSTIARCVRTAALGIISDSHDSDYARVLWERIALYAHRISSEQIADWIETQSKYWVDAIVLDMLIELASVKLAASEHTRLRRILHSLSDVKRSQTRTSGN